jgi:hypothetical protein
MPHESGDDLKRIEEVFGGRAGSPMSEGPAAKDLPPQNLEHDRYDERLWRELSEASRELADLAHNRDAPETFPALLNDLFLSYFKAQPNLLPIEGVEPRHRRANRPFVERTLEDPDTYRARAATRLDVASSGLAALAAGERLLEEIKNRPGLGDFFDRVSNAPAPPDQEDPDEQKERPEAGNPRVSDPETGEEGQPQEGPTAGDGAGEQEQAEAERPRPELPGRDARRAVRSASHAGREEADRVANAMAGWGLTPADLARVPLGERLELLKLLSGPQMARLLELVGRMRNLARKSAREAVRERADEIHSVETSGELSRLLPSELAALASDVPERRLEAEARLVEGRSLMHDQATSCGTVRCS